MLFQKLFAVLCVYLTSVDAATPFRLSPRIKGGQEVNIQAFPYMASLRELGNNEYKHRCGAVIVSEKYLLTAAQCFDSAQADWYGVAVGTDKKANKSEVIQTIKRFVIHEKYDEFATPFKHDIALIELDQPLKLSDRIKPLAINKNFIDGQVEASTLGFGGSYVSLMLAQLISVCVIVGSMSVDGDH